MSGISIQPCECHHSYQDDRYGLGMRIMNMQGKDLSKSTEVKCTVCGKKHHLKGVSTEQKKKK